MLYTDISKFFSKNGVASTMESDLDKKSVFR